MKQEKQVIEINGIFTSLKDGFIQARNLFVSTGTLTSYPNETEYDMAEEMIYKLIGKGMLSDKVEALWHYNQSLKNLHKYTVDEGEPDDK